MDGKHYETDTPAQQSGFIAQEVEVAMKECNYNFDGIHIPLNENDNYSIAYSQFVVPLVKAVQEQQEIIQKQNIRISVLEKKIATFCLEKSR